jgi:hypothetical protein
VRRSFLCLPGPTARKTTLMDVPGAGERLRNINPCGGCGETGEREAVLAAAAAQNGRGAGSGRTTRDRCAGRLRGSPCRGRP